MAEAPLNDQDAVAAIQTLPDQNQPDPSEDDQDMPPDDPDTDDQDDGDQDDDEDAPQIAAPPWWDAEAKTAFNDIPNTPAARDYARKIQQYVAEAEAKREAVTQRVKADAKSHIDAVRGALSTLNAGQPGEIDQFHRDYGDVDWAKMPQWAQQNPAEAASFFAQYHARRGRVEQLHHARAVAEHVAKQAFGREQSARLQQIAPELAGNADHLRALGDYARGTGLHPEAMKQASADELVILNKARLWDEAQAKAAAATKRPKPASGGGKTVRPVAAQVSGTHAQRTYAAARDRAFKSRNDDDAVAAILAGGF
jgi:hypothetical protein